MFLDTFARIILFKKSLAIGTKEKTTREIPKPTEHSNKSQIKTNK